MKEFLDQLTSGRSLSFEQAAAAMNRIISGKATAVQLAGFLVAIKAKGATADEIAGMAAAMRTRALAVDLPDDSAVDITGTGGDGHGSFNISTAAAIVAAAAGVKVAKQGNRAVSSLCGSANLLDALGIKVDAGPRTVREMYEKLGITFMFAPLFHSVLQRTDQARYELGTQTVFDLLGPATNPARVKNIIAGVSTPDMLDKMSRVFEILKTERAMVFSSADGLDELSLSGANQIVELRHGRLERTELTAADIGLSAAPLSALKGGDADRNAVIITDVLNGQEGPCLDVVALNAGAGIYVAGKAGDIREGVAMALETIRSGRAKEKLEDWKKLSRELNKR